MNGNALLIEGLEAPKSCNACKIRRLFVYMKPSPCPAVSSSLVANTNDVLQRREGCPITEVTISEVLTRRAASGKVREKLFTCCEVAKK